MSLRVNVGIQRIAYIFNLFHSFGHLVILSTCHHLEVEQIYYSYLTLTAWVTLHTSHSFTECKCNTLPKNLTFPLIKIIFFGWQSLKLAKCQVDQMT